MSRKGWHILREGDGLTLARRLPVRFDVVAETRLAQQIRQDLWRLLQRLGGFSPVIELTRRDGVVHVRAGGRIDGAVPSGTRDRIVALLADSQIRARWQSYAAHRRGLA